MATPSSAVFREIVMPGLRSAFDELYQPYQVRSTRERAMPRCMTKIRVTEPTMRESTWSLAKFDWWCASRYTHLELEDAGVPLSAMFVPDQTEKRIAFEEWLNAMPKVAQWACALRFDQERDFVTDSYMISAHAAGWFALSDDEAETERMLALVNVEDITGMQPLYFRYNDRIEHRPDGRASPPENPRIRELRRLLDEAIMGDRQHMVEALAAQLNEELMRERSTQRRVARTREINDDIRQMYRNASLLRPGSVDNDFNPDFTPDSLRINGRRLFNVGWASWRNVYGTLALDSVDDSAHRHGETATEIRMRQEQATQALNSMITRR